MGWASGADFAEDMWKIVRPNLLQKELRDTAYKLVKLFREHDCDNIMEAKLLYADAGYYRDADGEEHRK